MEISLVTADILDESVNGSYTLTDLVFFGIKSHAVPTRGVSSSDGMLKEFCMYSVHLILCISPFFIFRL